MLPTACYGSLLRISVTILEPVFKASFPTAFAPEYKSFDKSEEPSKEGPYTVTSLHHETSPLNRTNLPTATLI